MSEWKAMRIGDFCLVNPLTNLPKGSLAQKVAMEHVEPFTRRVVTFSREPYAGGAKFLNGDTIMARITPSLENGKTAYIDFLADGEVGFGSTEFIVLRERTNLSDRNFLYYLARSPEVRDIAILSMTGSSGRQRVQTEVVEDYEFLSPPLPEQKAIAAVLSSLDDKIDLLHRQNKTLVALAETLFRQWFVEEADEGWKEGKLGDFVSTNARSITKEAGIMAIRYLDTGSLTENVIEGYQYFELNEAPSRARRLVQHNDILLSTVRPNQRHYGIIKHPPDDLVVSTGFIVVTCDRIDPHFVYLFLTTGEMTKYLHSIAEGSTSAYPSLRPEDIERLDISLPPPARLRQFAELADGFWEKIDRNHTEIRTLARLRDSLLPKLMSGEVRVAL